MTADYLLWAGPGGQVARARIVAVGRWESAPIRRAVRQARREGRLIDLTYGHACAWVIYLDSGHLVLATEIFHPGDTHERPDPPP